MMDLTEMLVFDCLAKNYLQVRDEDFERAAMHGPARRNFP
jgi:hypothetical protein